MGRRRGSSGIATFDLAGTGAALVSAQVATGVAFVVLARRLEPESFGVFSGLYATGIALSGLLDFGSSQRTTRDLARGDGLDAFWPWLRRRTTLQVPPALVLVVAASILLDSADVSPLLVVGTLGQGVTKSLADATTAAVRALRSPPLSFWLIALGNCVFLGVTLSAPDAWLVNAAALGAMGSWLLTAALARRCVRRQLPKCSDRYPGNPWSGASGFGLVSLSVLVQGLHVPIIGAFAGPVAAGSLAAVIRWVQPVHLIIYGYCQHVFPDLDRKSVV